MEVGKGEGHNDEEKERSDMEGRVSVCSLSLIF